MQPWLTIAFLLFTAAYHVRSQSSVTEFINIDCGYEGRNYSSSNFFNWISDKSFVPSGLPAILYNIPFPYDSITGLRHLRYFPNGTKNCYSIPVPRLGRYLVRITASTLNYNGQADSPIFNISIGLSLLDTVTVTSGTVQVNEYVASVTNATRTGAAILNICFIRIDRNPIVNIIEIRPLPDGAYDEATLSHSVLKSVQRMANGFNYSLYNGIRYPLDSLDRTWYSDVNTLSYGIDYSITPLDLGANQTASNVAGLDSINYVPKFVGQNGRIPLAIPGPLNYTFFDLLHPQQFQVYLYFCELEDREVLAGSRVFDVRFNDVVVAGSFDIYKEAGNRKLKVVTLSIPLFQTVSQLVIQLVPHAKVKYPYPIISGIEIYQTYTPKSAVNASIVSALLDFASALTNFHGANEWIGDPCSPVSWPAVVCEFTRQDSAVTQLNMTGLNLSGEISPSLGLVSTIKFLLLGDNNLHGSIPDSLGNLKHLQTLSLQNNRLTGNIPESLASLNLTTVKLDNNSFNGSVPFTSPTLHITLAGNPGLCSPTGAYNLTVCPPLPASPPPATPSALPPSVFAPPPTSEPQAPVPSPGSPTGIIIGTVLAAIFLLLAVIGLIVLCLMRAWSQPVKSASLVSKSSGQLEKGEKEAMAQLPVVAISSSSSLDLHGTRLYSLAELRMATDDFSPTNQIGLGGFGPVFRGILANGSIVAIKKRATDSAQGQKEFFTEVELLSRVHHRHVVQLLGFCQESGQQVLVYPFMAQGTLRNHLYDSRGSPVGTLSWQNRLTIAFGVARGLEYLHTGSNPSIIHRDIKTSNILLDEHFEAHVADLGLSKLGPEGSESHVSTMVKGTAGYLDPEYYTVHKLTDRSDVYSFGVVLLEIITGRQPIDMLRARSERNLIDWVRYHLENADVYSILDSTILPNSFTLRALWKVAELAILCVEPLGQNRPSMSVVVRELKDALDYESIEADSFQYSEWVAINDEDAYGSSEQFEQ